MQPRLIVTILLVLGVTSAAQAANLAPAKIAFLKGDYAQAILECEKLLADAGSGSGLDELYCLLGLSYLKEANYLRASDVFEIIINEFPNSPYIDEARLGVGDCFYFQGNYLRAEEQYRRILSLNPKTKLLAPVYYRLSQCAVKTDRLGEAQKYLEQIKAEFPLSLEARQAANPLPASGRGTEQELYYTVQVGSFSNPSNAARLVGRLTDKGYPAYLLEAAQNKVCKVRVGRYPNRRQALEVEAKLKSEGYPTKIFP